jgi:hypothetical protein
VSWSAPARSNRRGSGQEISGISSAGFGPSDKPPMDEELVYCVTEREEGFGPAEKTHLHARTKGMASAVPQTTVCEEEGFTG